VAVENPPEHGHRLQSEGVQDRVMKMDRCEPGRTAARALAGEEPAIAVWMADRADRAAGVMKALGHEGRLMILCHLAGGEKSVTELEGLLGQRQAAVSQQLARLRLEGLVSTRREGKAIHYAILDQRVLALLRALPHLLGEGL
jgi:ArsR family transcriptional regulator